MLNAQTQTDPLDAQVEKVPDYREYLFRELEARKTRNAGYSLRAFARDLGLHAPKLSQILSRQCGVSERSARSLAKKLGLSVSESEFFVALVGAAHNRSKSARERSYTQIKEIVLNRYDNIDLDQFKILADWYHFAILELSEVKDFDSNPKWIAARLGLDRGTVELAIQRLIEKQLLTRNKAGRLVQTYKSLATPTDLPSREIRAHHAQILKKAAIALEENAVSARDYSTMTFAIDTRLLPEAKKMLKEFRRRFCSNFENRGSLDSVYCLAMQFFPLDERQKQV
jgi:uncharacterized protein (TIGR02147 family)